jgi:hypothetical protein
MYCVERLILLMTGISLVRHWTQAANKSCGSGVNWDKSGFYRISGMKDRWIKAE